MIAALVCFQDLPWGGAQPTHLPCSFGRGLTPLVCPWAQTPWLPYLLHALRSSGPPLPDPPGIAASITLIFH